MQQASAYHRTQSDRAALECANKATACGGWLKHKLQVQLHGNACNYTSNDAHYTQQ